MIFLPQMMNQRFGYVNLDLEVSSWLAHNGFTPEEHCPLVDPAVCDAFVSSVHHELALDWSYGGWMEDRSNIRRGSYLDKERRYLHTGIDLNVPAHTSVHAIVDGPIVYQGNDSPIEGGWGGHVIQVAELEGRLFALVYAHLDETTAPCTHVRRGHYIGTVGESSVNGGWRPHLHLQLISIKTREIEWSRFIADLDGYMHANERAKWARICPDPTRYIF